MDPSSTFVLRQGIIFFPSTLHYVSSFTASRTTWACWRLAQIALRPWLRYAPLPHDDGSTSSSFRFLVHFMTILDGLAKSHHKSIRDSSQPWNLFESVPMEKNTSTSRQKTSQRDFRRACWESPISRRVWFQTFGQSASFWPLRPSWPSFYAAWLDAEQSSLGGTTIPVSSPW